MCFLFSGGKSFQGNGLRALGEGWGVDRGEFGGFSRIYFSGGRLQLAGSRRTLTSDDDVLQLRAIYL